MLTTVPFRRLIWALPIFWALHELEEWNILDWYQRHWVNVPDMTDTIVRTWLVFISLVGFVWTGVGAVIPNDRLRAVWTLPFFTVLPFGNALQHIYFVYEFDAYAPGVISAVLLIIPGVLFLTWIALRRGLLPWWYVAIIYLPTFPQVRLVVQAGNVVPPQMHSVYEFSADLAARLGLGT